MPLSEGRRREIKRLVYEGGEELTQAIALGDEAADRNLAAIHREISDFLRVTTSAEELDFFAENWTRDGREGPIHQLIKNPHVDAGTLLRLYWLSDPEFYCSTYRSPSEVDDGTDRDIFMTVEAIERRIVESDYETATVPFDPGESVTMSERRSHFVRPIPEVM